MLDSGLLSKNFIGRDGFIWWIGQVPDAKFWKGNIPTLPQNKPSDLPGFKYRVKVRVLGYHTSDLTKLPDEDLPWALVMLPTTAGSGSGGNAVTPRFSGGEFVFGFFLDGDNGQQPVIIGMLGNSTQTLLSKSLPSVGFKPYSGYSSTGKSIPTHGLRTSKEIQKSATPNAATSVPTGSKGGAPSVSQSGTTPSATTSASQEASNSTGDLKTQHQDQQQQNNKEFILANACKKDTKKKDKIKTAIKNLIRAVKGAQKYYDKYVSPTTNLIFDITSQIRVTAGLITGYLKDLLNDFRAWILNEINKRVKKQVASASTKKQMEAGETQQKAIDTLSCVFNRIIDGLLDLIVAFLTKMLDRILGAAECIIDNMIGALLNSIIAPLESAITTALGPLNSLLSGFSAGLSQALDFSSALERFLSCEKTDQCPEVEKWSWLDGPKPSSEDDYSRALSNVRGSVSSGISSFLNNPSVSSISPGTDINCFSGLGVCGPPIVSVFGGGGVGTLANAIIGAEGEILAVDILNPGLNYYSNPFVYFDDPCGNGSGAKAEAVVGTDGDDCGKIIGIKVLDGGKGYLKRSDGSLGSEGEVSVGIGSDASALILPSGADFTITTKMFGFDGLVVSSTTGVSTSILSDGFEVPCGIVTSYPSVPISVLPGTTVTLPPSASVILSPSMEDLKPDCRFSKSGTTYTFPEGCEITIPPIVSEEVKKPETSPTDDYGVILELDEVHIKNTGINYSSKDKICISPDNGANLEPQFDPYGRLIGVKILNKGTFVTERPTISICESDTGVNAEMFAVLKATKKTKEEAQKLGFSQEKLVSVIDCVGKVNV